MMKQPNKIRPMMCQLRWSKWTSVARALVLTLILSLWIVNGCWAATLLPNGEQTFVDGNGAPFAGGQVFFYVPNTSTPKNTWQDPNQVTLNTNPVILDAAGRAVIYGAGTYRQVLQDADGNTIWDQLTQDLQSLFESGLIINGGTSSGSANAQIINPSSPVGSLVVNQILTFIAGFTNSGSTTLNVSGIGPLPVTYNSLPLGSGIIRAGNTIVVAWDGAEFQIIAGAVGGALLGVNNLADVTNANTSLNNILPSQGSHSGAFLSTNGTNASWTGLGTLVKSVHVQTFCASGCTTTCTTSCTYTPSTGLINEEVEMVGGGGGSSGQGGNTGSPGGGAGGYLDAGLTAAQVGVSQTITIGAGGTAGTTGPTSGGNGGTTSVGSLMSCTGGIGSGVPTTGGSQSNWVSGGLGGTCSVGTGTFLVTRQGAQGGMGGQAGTASGGVNIGGYGGSGPFGDGGGQVFSGNAPGTHNDGNSGTGFGSGGGGSSDSSASATAGKAGQPGMVKITEYCTQ